MSSDEIQIEDYLRYDPCDGSKTFDYTYDTTKGTAQYGTYGGSASLYVPGNCNLIFGDVTGNFEVEFDYYPTNDHVWKRITLNGTNEAVFRSNWDTATPAESVMVYNIGWNKWIHIKLTKNGNSLTIQADSKTATGTLKRTVTNPITVSINPNTNCYYKNIKLKQL